MTVVESRHALAVFGLFGWPGSVFEGKLLFRFCRVWMVGRMSVSTGLNQSSRLNAVNFTLVRAGAGFRGPEYTEAD